MRTLIVGLFVVFSLSLAPFPVAADQQGCSCKGCGCKGGPGWRGPEGTCVPRAKLAQICGSPAGAPCVQEAATQVCFATPSGSRAPEAQTQAP